MNIATLSIEILAQVTRLEQGMSQAKNIIGRTMGDIERSVESVNKVLGLVGVGLSAGAVVAYANKVIGSLADLNDMAQKTGSSVENLSKFQQLSIEFGHDFNLMDTSLSKLAKGMSQFDSSTNYTNRALKALGVESRDAAGKLRDPSDVMIDIAKRLQNYSDGAGKAALITDIFGKSGADLLPILNDMAENTDRYRGVNAEAAAEADQFQNQIGNLSREADQLAQSMVGKLVPAFSDILKAMVDGTQQGGIFQGILSGIGALSKNLFNTDRLLPQDQKIVARLQEIQGEMDAILDRRKAWYMPSNYADSELQSLNLEAVALQKELALLQQVNEEKAKPDKPQLEYLGGAEGAETASAYERASKAAGDYIQRLKEETENVGLNTVQLKLMAAARAAAQAPLESQRMAIMQEAQAWALATQAQEANVAAAKALQDEEKKRLDEYAALVSADEKSLASLIEKNNLLQYGAEAVAAMGRADLQAALDRAWAAENVDPEVISMLERRIELSKQIAAETSRGAVLQAEQEAAKAASDAAKTSQDEWMRMFGAVEQTGRMAFVQLLAYGTGTAKSIGQAIKASIIDLLYQLTLRKFVIHLEASLVGSMASGAANAAGGAIGNSFSLMNIASGAKSIFSAFTGGASGLVEAIGTSAIGQALGLGVAGGSALGAGVGAGAGAGTAFIGGAGTALGGTGATVAGLSGMGSMLAAAAGPVAIAAAVDTIFRLIAGNKTIKGAEALSYVPVIGPIVNALFGMGPKKLGPAELTGTFSDTGFAGQFEADWTRKGGLFSFGKKHGRRGLGITSEQDAALDAMVGDISSAFLDLTKTTGDAGRSLEGWTFQVKRQIDTEEQQEALTKDLTNSIGEKLIPELTLIQQKGEDLGQTAARATGEFKLMNAVLDLTGMTLSKTGLASLGMRDSIIQLLGGLDSAGGVFQSFFNDFYTDAERVASTGRIVNDELTKLGVTTLPTTKEQFRDLVEAQDLNTEAGQKMFAALLQIAPAFASVGDAAQKAADDAAAAAKQLADSIQLLTTDSFATLFDYTKYIRLAANAGVTAAQPAGPVFQPSGQTYMPSFAVGSNELPSDMTARVHKGERIIPAADNRELMRRLSSPDAANDALVAEIRQLRAELKAAHLAIAKNTSKTAKILDMWDGNGQPPERDA
jgi:hypothetical protein